FENLADELIEHYIIIDRQGEAIAREVIERCKLEVDWVLKLRRLHSDGYIKGSWSLVDCEEMAKAHKYTFYKPSRYVTDQLEVGNLVKLNFQLINYIYREEPLEIDDERNVVDSGWRIMTVKETEEYADNPDNFSFVSLGVVLSRDDSFINILEAEIGSSFERNEDGIFEQVEE
ncbi:MAG TPA: DUF2185 domain-containing protein, partial [Saprospiraceae bacterium]|nr:DUF2185 domain-containing protein [Saprospiraceae bacterium]